MSYTGTVYKIMIASPSDITNERQIAREIIYKWNNLHAEDKQIILLPVGWDTNSAPLMGTRPQDIINKQVLENSDVLIGIFWTRIGTPTGEALSGTIEEIDRHIASGKPTMLYFSTAPVRPDSIDEMQYNKLKQFKEKCLKEGLIEVYDSIEQFEKKLSDHLTIIINTNSFFVKNNSFDDSLKNDSNVENLDYDLELIRSLSEESKIILLEASQDNRGSVLKVRVRGGILIQTNSKQLVQDVNPRITAAWESALEELIQFNLLEAQGYKGEVFLITHKGYQIADKIKQ